VAVVTDTNTLPQFGNEPVGGHTTRICVADVEVFCVWVKMMKAEAARLFLTTKKTSTCLRIEDHRLESSPGLGVILPNGFELGLFELGVGVVASAQVFRSLGAPNCGIFVGHWKSSKDF